MQHVHLRIKNVSLKYSIFQTALTDMKIIFTGIRATFQNTHSILMIHETKTTNALIPSNHQYHVADATHQSNILN